MFKIKAKNAGEPEVVRRGFSTKILKIRSSFMSIYFVLVALEP